MRIFVSEFSRPLRPLSPDEPLRVALFWPSGPDVTYTLPMGLGYLKSNTTDPRVELRLFDCVLEKADSASPKVEAFLREYRPHIVGVSAWSAYFGEALALLHSARAIDPKVITLVGGVHASAYPVETAREEIVDFVISGEAEISFGKFLAEFYRDQPDWSQIPGLLFRTAEGIVHQNPMELVADIDKLAIPDYDFINLRSYIENGYRMKAPSKWNAPIWASRGCPYRCNFCSAPIINGNKIRHHSVSYLIDWIKTLYHDHGIRWINIVDDNFTFDVNFAKSFCRTALELNLPGLGFGTSNGVRMQRGDKELWRLMKRAGWRTVIVAPESGSEATLKLMNKGLKIAVVPQIVEDIRSAHLHVHGFFMVGYPGETVADLRKTADFIRSTRFDSVVIQRFLPLPGTPIYETLVNEGKIPRGYLPDNLGFGNVRFVDESLKDFNFTRYILGIQLWMALRHPLSYFRVLTDSGGSFLRASIAHLLSSLFMNRRSPPAPGLQ